MTEPSAWNERPRAPVAGTDVCAVDDIADGAARAFAFGGGWPAFELIVARQADRFYGYVNECPHQPLPLNIDSRVFARDYELHCDHHFAVFSFADGRCVDGVCRGQTLAPVPLEVLGRRVRIAGD